MSNKVKPVLPVSLKATGGKATDRRVWSIPLQGVWLPFFTAANTTGESAIPADALGHPLRLALEKDGTPRISSSGNPVFRVAKDINDQVRIIRDNFMTGLLSYAATVANGMPDAYKAQVEAARKAGQPLAQKDADTLADYAADQSGDGDAPTQPEPDKVLVTA